MNCKTTTAILTFVLGAFVLLDIIFAWRAINRSREFRTLQVQAFQNNAYRMQVESLANDVAVFNQKNPNPDLTKLLQAISKPPAAPAK